MEIKIKFEDSLKTRITDGFCAQYNYPARVTIDGVETDNPVSKEEFMGQTLTSFVKESVVAFETNQAVNIYREAFIQKSKSEIILG